jgi:flagellar motility protein MotE (MotC chaperone)
MKLVLWVSFYFIAFAGMVGFMYFRKDTVIEKTEEMPILNYTQYHRDAIIADDSSYVEKIDSLATVVGGMLNQMAGYVIQLKERDEVILRQNWRLEKVNKNEEELKKKIEELKNFNAKQANNDKELQELSKTLSSMKGDVLGPILENLSDQVVKILYDKAKKKDKANLLKSLKPKRAGKLMNELAGTKK